MLCRYALLYLFLACVAVSHPKPLRRQRRSEPQDGALAALQVRAWVCGIRAYCIDEIGQSVDVVRSSVLDLNCFSKAIKPSGSPSSFCH